MTDPVAFLVANPPRGNLSDVFETDDRSEKLIKFVEESRTITEQDPPAYYWPSEVDPHAAEVMEWQRQHVRKLFPLTLQQGK
jgi:hypothetical protein